MTRYLLAVIHAAIEAGQEILEVYQTDFDIEHKKDDSPLTLADKRAHAVIERALSGFSLPILSEEGRNIPYSERKNWDTFWLVDPLDGTKEFIKKNGEFTVNIALIDHHRPVLGVIYVPVKNILYFSSQSTGAYTYMLPESELPKTMDLDNLINVSSKLPLRAPVREFSDKRPYTIVGSRSHATPELLAFVEKKKTEYDPVEFISAGSSLKLCLVAEGKADIYPRLGPTMEWDTAAGQAIAEGSGLLVKQYGTESPLSYNKENLLNPWFIVQGR